MNRIPSHRPTLVFTLATLAMLAGCTTKTVQTAPMFAARVVVAKAIQKTVPVDLTAIGSAEAFTNVSIKAQVNAVLNEVHIKEGQFVKKGDLLFTLDARPFEAALASGAGDSRARQGAGGAESDARPNRYAAALQGGRGGERAARPDEGQRGRAAGCSARGRSRRGGGAASGGLLQNLRAHRRAAGAMQVYPGNIVKENDVPMLIVINQMNADLHRFFDSRTVSRRRTEIHGARASCEWRRRPTETRKRRPAT